LTRWQTLNVQSFEIDLEIGTNSYHYALSIEHNLEERKARIKKETLKLDGKPLFDFEDGEAHLYRDNYSAGPNYPFDWTQSGVGVLMPRADNKKLTRFREEIRKIVIASIHPMSITSLSERDER